MQMQTQNDRDSNGESLFQQAPSQSEQVLASQLIPRATDSQAIFDEDVQLDEQMEARHQ